MFNQFPLLQAVRATKLGARLLHEGRVDESGTPSELNHQLMWAGDQNSLTLGWFVFVWGIVLPSYVGWFFWKPWKNDPVMNQLYHIGFWKKINMWWWGVFWPKKLKVVALWHPKILWETCVPLYQLQGRQILEDFLLNFLPTHSLVENSSTCFTTENDWKTNPRYLQVSTWYQNTANWKQYAMGFV